VSKARKLVDEPDELWPGTAWTLGQNKRASSAKVMTTMAGAIALAVQRVHLPCRPPVPKVDENDEGARHRPTARPPSMRQLLAIGAVENFSREAPKPRRWARPVLRTGGARTTEEAGHGSEVAHASCARRNRHAIDLAWATRHLLVAWVPSQVKDNSAFTSLSVGARRSRGLANGRQPGGDRTWTSPSVPGWPPCNRRPCGMPRAVMPFKVAWGASSISWVGKTAARG
jgi:hypothetical protein